MSPRPVATTRITSVDNAQVKAIARLLDSARERREAGRFVLEGSHLVDAFDRAGTCFESLVITDAGLAQPELRALYDRVQSGQRIVVTERVFGKLSELASPVGILGVCSHPGQVLKGRADGDVVFLDRIQDAGNVGTIMRTAAAAGVATLVCGAGSADAWSPRVLRAAMGAHCAVTLAEFDFAEARRLYPSHQLLATDANAAEDLYACDLTKPTMWLFGNEGSGLDATLAAHADRMVRIPITTTVESLNVAAAAAICLFEQRRQRLAAPSNGRARPRVGSINTRAAKSARPE